MSRLLIIACSARKRAGAELMPAIARYDGPAFRVLRKYLRERPTDDLAVLILSARFGLIPAARGIPDYDLRMTRAGAERLRARVLARLRAQLDNTAYPEIGLCLGRRYQAALTGYEGVVPGGTTVTAIAGGLGPRLTRLHEWLRAARPTPAAID
jgi:hypothetical protein